MSEVVVKTADPAIAWKPQGGPQTLFCACPYDEVFYGGAAGGGKTDAVIGKYALGIERYGHGWHGVIFRQHYKNLEEIERRCLEIFSPIYGSDRYKVGRHTWEFPSGATLKLRTLSERNDVYQFQGHQYPYIAFDELTQWPDDWWWEYLRSRNRSPHGCPCSINGTSNPGGVGHNWVKAYFLQNDDGTHLPPLNKKQIITPKGRVITRFFIPAKLEDNQILMEMDPLYEDKLESMSDPILRRALREGDWEIISGTALPELRRDVHVVPNCTPPRDNHGWFALDWGTYRPYAGLWAFRNSDAQIVVWNELYPVCPKPNVGSGESAKIVRDKIVDIEREYRIRCYERYIDPQCFEKDPDNPSVVANLGGDAMGWIAWSKGPGSRLNQKNEIHEKLKIVNGKSGLVFCERCVHTWRTLLTLPRDDKVVEDVDTDAEDHLYDALRGIVCKNVPTKDEWNDMLKARRRQEFEERAHGQAAPYGGW